jgi:ribonucrease Y
MELYLLIGIFGGFTIGLGTGYIIRRSIAQGNVHSAEAKAEQMLQEGKAKQQEVMIKAKDKAIQIIDDAKKDEQERRNELQKAQKRLEQRESMFDKKLLDIEDRKGKLEEKVKKIESIKANIEKLKQEQMNKLQEVASLSKEAAADRLFKMVEEEQQDALMSRVRKLGQATEEELEKESRKLISLAITRYASSQATDTTTTQVNLPSDEMKGRIIGKEGRNIKSLEQLVGCEIIVDDTPEMITISGFSPIRRQMAKRALDILIKDGRIHPARIEDAVQEAKKSLAIEIKKAGEDALYELGIPVSSIDPKLISILGRLKFRTSYGQNVLQHSIEVAQLSASIGEELGADVTVCKKGGLFHDIGKAVDHDMQGAHPEIGYNILKKFKFPEEVAYQSIAHHEDRPKTVEGTIIKASDAISGARPGARKHTLEQFLQRMEELEQTASTFPGVDKAYAIQAGREVRVFVQPQEIDDFSAYKMAKEIAQKIEGELQYPGEVKVTLIRETRVIEYAR